jgi:uncharacterized cupin superfamily protein
MGITHFDEARAIDYALEHLTSRWTLLGESAGSATIGVRRIQIPQGHWSTPAHEHGAEEEIFYVLAGRGVSWQSGRTCEIRAGDCILYAPRRGAHTIHALEAIDVLAFGNRHHDNASRFPRLDYSLVGGRAIPSAPGVIDRAPFQFVKESQLGPPELPDPLGERPATVANIDQIESRRIARGRSDGTARFLGRTVGAKWTGLNHVVIAPGKESAPPHCHSVEEELFVVLEGTGALVLVESAAAGSEQETAVRAGHVISRPAGTGVGHTFRAGPDGMTMLAYGTRDTADIIYYPRSDKISFKGVGVIGRIERLDYWDGEG